MHADERGRDRLTSEGWPLEMVVFGEFVPREEGKGPAPTDPPALGVDKDSFDGVLARLARRVSVKVPVSWAEPPEDTWIQLPLEGIRSFHPDGFVVVVPELRELVEIRRLATRIGTECSLEELRQRVARLPGARRVLDRLPGASSVDAATREVAPPPAAVPAEAPPSEKERRLDSLLGMVEMPGGAPDVGAPDPASGAAALVARVLPVPTEDAPLGPRTTAQIRAELDRMLTTRVNSILHHPEIRRLEAMWRGLKLLVERTDFHEPIRIEVRNAPKDEVVERLARFAEERAGEGERESGLVVLAAYEFDRSPRDIATLRRVSEVAEALQAPVISSVGLEFLGLGSGEELERLSGLEPLFEESEYTEWRGLRALDSSRWLTLAFNRLLARPPYDPEQARVRAFELRELPLDALLWSDPVWAVGAVLADRFARSGWYSDLAGWREGLIQDLPVRVATLPSGRTTRAPLEALLSVDQVDDLTRFGLAVVVSSPNRDTAILPTAPTVHAPERYSDPDETRQAARRARLPYQLLVARLAGCARLVSGQVVPGLRPEIVADIFKRAFLLLIPVEGEGDPVEVEVRESERSADRYDVSLTLRPEEAGWGQPPVRLQCSVPR
jgi:type VI secretion system protein ImpC